MRYSKNKFSSALKATAVAVSTLALTGCLASTVTQGTGGSAVSGAAGGGTSAGASNSLERCDQTLGTLAVDDGRGANWYADFNSRTKITTIEPLLRLAVQQSNCFVITSIGNQRTDARLSAITDKQRNSGEFRAGSNQQKGQSLVGRHWQDWQAAQHPRNPLLPCPCTTSAHLCRYQHRKAAQHRKTMVLR